MTGNKETNAAIEGGKYRVVVAPLGELPAEEALRDFVEEVREEERGLWLCKSTFSKSLGKDPADIVRRLLEEVRSREGVRLRRVAGKAPPQEDTVSALTVVGVHGTRSVYIAHYGWPLMSPRGRLSCSPFEVLDFLSGEEEVGEQLDFLEEMLLRRYPPLREFPVSAFVEAVKVGQVVFPIDLTGHAPCVLIGETTLPLLKRGRRSPLLWPLPWERIARADEEALVRVLRKRTLLGLLPAKTARNLLRGKGDPKEVERVAAMARLSGL